MFAVEKSAFLPTLLKGHSHKLCLPFMGATLILTFLGHKIILRKSVEVATQSTGPVIMLVCQSDLDVPIEVHLGHKAMIFTRQLVIPSLNFYEHSIGGIRYGNPVGRKIKTLILCT